jgi:hypothetical protein
VEQEEHLNGASLEQGSALSANIKLGLKSMPQTNSVTYYEHVYVIDAKVL